jgi:hypothetical protein
MKRLNILLIILALLVCFSLIYRADSYEFDEEALEWALGEDFGSLPISMIDDAWNRRHGDLWYCSGTMDPYYALDKMINMYYGRYEKIKDLKCPSN